VNILKGWIGVGSSIIAIGIITLIIYHIGVSLSAKAERSRGESSVEMIVDPEKIITQIMLENSKEDPPVPIVHNLKAGEWSEWIFIMGKRVRIFPNDNNVEYELKNIYGKVRSEKGGRNWKDLTQFQRFKSKTDITYTVEKW